MFGLVRSPGRFETTASVVFEPFQIVPERPRGLQAIGFLDPTLPGGLQTTVFADPAPPGDLQTAIFVDPERPGSLATTRFVDPTQTGGRLNIGFWRLKNSRKPPDQFFYSAIAFQKTPRHHCCRPTASWKPPVISQSAVVHPGKLQECPPGASRVTKSISFVDTTPPGGFWQPCWKPPKASQSDPEPPIVSRNVSEHPPAGCRHHSKLPEAS